MNDDLEFIIRPTLTVLDSKQILCLVDRALDVLSAQGVRVLHREASRLLQNAGASVGQAGRIRIPARLVEQAIESAPKRLLIYDREGNPAMELGGGNTGGQNTFYGTGSDLRHTVDPVGREIRLTVAEDIGDMAKVVERMENIEFLMSYGIPSDCALEKVYLVEFVQMVSNSRKPIVFTSDNETVSTQIIEMAALVAGGINNLQQKPYVLNYSQPTSPLQHSEDAIGKVFACADHWIPLVYPPGMIPGATAPATLAGVIVQSLAESFSALAIHQLRRKGAPIVLGGAHGCMDMHTAINVYAAPERLKTQAALAEIYQYFGLPTWGFGGCTDALSLDTQAGYEFGMLSLWASLCGINLAHDVGYLGSGMVGDLRAIVLNDEINAYVRSVLRRGTTVDREHLALDALRRVAAGGNYLEDEHTLQHFRTEFWEPRLSNRDSLAGWQQKGSPAISERAGKAVKEILDSQQDQGVDPKLIQELNRMAG
jgi:trimethylamine--corrinoid protein Co-methyltransferase